MSVDKELNSKRVEYSREKRYMQNPFQIIYCSLCPAVLIKELGHSH